MLTHQEIAAYAEEMQRGENTGSESSEQWRRLYEQQLAPLREQRIQVAEWYREYEEKTQTVLGCD